MQTIQATELKPGDRIWVSGVGRVVATVEDWPAEQKRVTFEDKWIEVFCQSKVFFRKVA